MPKVICNDIELFYTDQGHGKPVVFISGLGATHESWIPVSSILQNDYRIIQMDNRGIGETATKTMAPFNIQDMGNDVLALMNELQLEQACLVGHSMGTAIAMSAAAQDLSRIRKLVLAGPFITLKQAPYFAFKTNADLWESETLGPAELFRVIMPWLFSEAFLSDEKGVNEAIEFAKNNPPPQSATDFKRQLQALKEFDATPLIKQIHQSTLIISGDQDITTPATEAQKLADEMAHATHSVISSAHCGILEQPHVIAQLIKDFIR